MSKLSSDTLFHFTTWDNLVSILENGFQPKFSLEKFCFPRGISFETAIPMVSFCDIPLSQIRLHVKRYGSYGLGLTKKWGVGKGMNPVLYLKENSNFSLHMRNTMEILTLLGHLTREQGVDNVMMQKQLSSLKIQSKVSLDKLNSIKKSLIPIKKRLTANKRIMDNVRQALNAIATISLYIKQYDGYSLRSGRSKKEKIRFYDEREWRYVPNIETHDSELLKLGIVYSTMDKKDFNNHGIREQANALIGSAKLSFSPNCIRYIIVQKEKEILEMITKLEGIKGNKYPANVIKILTSRILTYEQIEKDF